MHEDIWNEILASTQSFLLQPSNGHLAKSPISPKAYGTQKGMSIRSDRSWPCVADPWMGAYSGG